MSALKGIRLATKCRLRPSEGVPIGAQAEEGNGRRAVALHLGREAFRPGDEFGRRQLVRRGSCAVHQVRQPEAMLQGERLLGRMKLARRKAGAVQSRPEAVAWTG